jgi:hypothetical protein
MARDGAAHDRLGDHRRVDAHPGQARWTRASCRRRRARAGSSSASGRRRSSSTTRRRRRRRRSGRCATRSRSRAGRPLGRAVRLRRRHVECRRAGAAADAHAPREVPPVYVAATAPKMQQLAGEIADGASLPSITTPASSATRAKRRRRDRRRLHRRRLDPRVDREAGRDGAREIAGMYLANKVQNIQGAADTLLDLAGIEQDEIRPSPRRWSGADASREGRGLGRAASTSAGRSRARRPTASGDRGVPRRRLQPRDARALGREPARADPALRREGVAAISR